MHTARRTGLRMDGMYTYLPRHPREASLSARRIPVCLPARLTGVTEDYSLPSQDCGTGLIHRRLISEELLPFWSTLDGDADTRVLSREPARATAVCSRAAYLCVGNRALVCEYPDHLLCVPSGAEDCSNARVF